MEFNRLSEVEKLAEVPAGASALAEADGKIVRLPFGGGASLEDLMFDLEVDMSSGGRIELTNKDQLQKVYDNNMSLYIFSHQDTSGGRRAFSFSCPFVKEMLVVTPSGDSVLAKGLYHDTIGNNWQVVNICFDLDKYNQDGTMVVTDGSYLVYNSSYTVDKVYASVF